MRRRLAKTACLATIAVLVSGCSLSSTGKSGSSGTQKYSVSESFWRSDDGGKTWTAKSQMISKPTESDLDILNIAINPVDSRNVLIGLRTGGLVETVDKGETLEFTKLKLEKIYGLAIDPVDPKTVYASSLYEDRGKILKTTDGGENWNDIYTFPNDGPLVVWLTLDRKNPNVLFASTSNDQVIRSLDGGTSWQNVFQASGPVVRIAIDPANSKLVYLLTQGGEVFASQDQGQTFVSLSKQISDSKLPSSGYGVMKTDPYLGGVLYVGGKSGLIKSTDGGKTWTKVAILNDPADAPVRAIAIDPSDSKKIIYGAGQAAYRSVDGGTSWTTFQFDNGKVVNAIEYDAYDPNTVYLGFANK